MGTKSNPGKFDCYAAAEPNEPMFVLLARDGTAPAIVLLWTVLRRKLRGIEDEKAFEAAKCAREMLDWQAANKPAALMLAEEVDSKMKTDYDAAQEMYTFLEDIRVSARIKDNSLPQILEKYKRYAKR